MIEWRGLGADWFASRRERSSPTAICGPQVELIVRPQLEVKQNVEWKHALVKCGKYISRGTCDKR
jgi:hypothetical protein